MADDSLKKLLTEWAVLDRLWREMRDGDVRNAIEARREVLRAQISALAAERGERTAA